jgi:YHS domain-containing protein
VAPSAAFTERIRGRLRLTRADKLRKLQETEVEMHAWSGEREHLHQAAESLYREAVLPLLLCLPEHFANVEVKTVPSRYGPSGIARFEPTERFPAAVTLVLGVHRAPADRGLVVEYRLEIVPALMDYEAEDDLLLVFEEFGRPATVAAWVEARLLRFVDTYLQLETNSYYQARNARTDPVCGMHVWTTTAECIFEYAGRTLHFCSEACRTRFVERPGRFLW